MCAQTIRPASKRAVFGGGLRITERDLSRIVAHVQRAVVLRRVRASVRDPRGAHTSCDARTRRADPESARVRGSVQRPASHRRPFLDDLDAEAAYSVMPRSSGLRAEVHL